MVQSITASSLEAMSCRLLFDPMLASRTSPLPNNLGPTLLLAIGLIISPLLIGVPLVLLGLARLRTAEGHKALPELSRWKAVLLARSRRWGAH